MKLSGRDLLGASVIREEVSLQGRFVVTYRWWRSLIDSQASDSSSIRSGLNLSRMSDDFRGIFVIVVVVFVVMSVLIVVEGVGVCVRMIG